jgi:iron complex outermembrane receptor protein
MSVRTRVHGSFGGRKASLVALAVAGALAASGASAQETAGQENLGEIVVTAQKREERLQEVPIAISVVGADTLDRAGGFNIEGISTLVPTLNLRKTNVSLNQSLFLRGVGTVSFAIAAQPSVAFVLDGVVLSSSGEAFGDLYDVDRVEVLRGPQGTLFGKNASAGVINVVTKRPGKDFGGYVDVGMYQDDETKVKAAIDTPLSDTLRGRTTVFWGNFPGYLDNITTTGAGGKTNGYYRKGARTVWNWDPSETVGVTFSADYRTSDDPCCSFVVGTPAAGGAAAVINGSLAGLINGDEGRAIRQDTENRSQERNYGAALQLDIGLPGDHTLTSISSWRKWNANEVRDGDYTDIAGTVQGFNATRDNGPQDQKTWSQELRVASPNSGLLTYVGGLYFSKLDATRTFTRVTTQCSPALALAANTPCPGGSVRSSGTANFGASIKNLAAFADGTWHLNDNFRLITGLRWTQDKLDFFHSGRSVVLAPGVAAAGGVAGPLGVALAGDSSFNNTSGRAGVQWDVSRDFMAYATYARGYKGPAYNVFFNMILANTAPLKAETTNSIEAGFKSTLGGGRTVLNVAAFKADYKNYQANNFYTFTDPATGNVLAISQLTNAGNVSTQGVELDLISKPSDRLTITGGVAYTDAQIDKFNPPPAGSPSLPVTQKGDPLPFAPKWKGSLSAEWRIDVGNWKVSPGFTASYQSLSYADIGSLSPALGSTLTIRKIPAYGLFDATLAIADADDRFRLTLVGRNLTNQSYPALVQQGPGAGGLAQSQVFLVPRDADRYFGAQVRFGFGGGK